MNEGPSPRTVKCKQGPDVRVELGGLQYLYRLEKPQEPVRHRFGEADLVDISRRLDRGHHAVDIHLDPPILDPHALTRMGIELERRRVASPVRGRGEHPALSSLSCSAVVENGVEVLDIRRITHEETQVSSFL
jgi:hypothetical protein